MADPIERVQAAKRRQILAEHDRQQRWRDAPSIPVRHPAGRRKSTAPRKDRGTDQIRAKRLAAGGHEGVPHDYPLAVLAARKKITDAQAEAGKILAGMRAIVCGLPYPPAAQWASLVALGIVSDGRPGATLDGDESEKRYRKVSARYDDAIGLLDRTGVNGRAEPGEPRSTSVVVKVAVFDQPLNRGELKLLRAGLRALTIEWSMEDK